jgi:uncharacterized membrane protein YoaK (UPF0700 family)
MMTGNLIMISIALAEKNWADAMTRMSFATSFFIGTCTSRNVEWLSKQNDPTSIRFQKRHHLKYVAFIAFTLFALYARLAATQKWAINLLPLAFGMVYSSANQELGGTITQLMTGHLTKLGTAFSDRAIRQNKTWNDGSLMSVCIVGSFMIGAFAGLIISVSPFGKGDSFFAMLGLLYAASLSLF